ncbi:hypothetical protein HG535_0F04060 [Zygotorulaspora mrakii]|uniref:DUF2415 domain-containing protein n=1 Tax=Zygotorulaspora mrakii TaxID=42260 RepID=A0A7H9B6F3_ZYGMR|nr:uncharacterized protein HG535_0F04060 [Zygotorulaspora mrakii]QLG73894.1 hypothetical protein HG535_0F04060 [Zygotorulaspora mrakii]
MTIDGNHSSNDEVEDENLNTGSDKVFQNYMMPGLELYDAKVSINHWQLRDCIKHSSTDPGKLYYIYDHQIRSLDTGQASQSNTRSKKLNSSKIRRNSFNVARKNSSGLTSVKGNLNLPSKKTVEFNFKPRSFTECNGLVACGGLIGPDDKGFPTNWSRLSNDTNDGEPLPPPAEPVKLTNNNVLSDHSNYSNPSIWKGIISLCHKDTGIPSSVIVGQFINNCVTLSSRTNQEYDLYSCNNDGHLYQCSINNRGVELVRRYSDLKFALNNAAISHDSKTLIVSGDSNKFAIYRQNELAGQFLLSYDNQPDWGSSVVRSKRIPRFALPDGSGFVDHIYEAPNGDHGFYSCFSENDLQFATLFQNGVCLVYDVRNMETPLTEITSTRPHSHNGAFRVCKFSYGLDDLLFISEHQGRVHVVDTRNFMNHQVILVPDKLKSETEELITTNMNDMSNNSTDTRRRNIPFISAVSRVSSSSSVSSYAIGSRRRHSNPTPPPSLNNEPWLTSATSIPLRYLEPQVVPYPKAVNKLTNNTASFQQHLNDDQNEDTSLSTTVLRRRSSYRVRRFSTSSNMCEDTGEMDPAILDSPNSEHSYPRVDNYNYQEQRTGIFVRDARIRTPSNATFEEDELLDAHVNVNSGSPGQLNNRLYFSSNDYAVNSLANYSNADFTEENNISGIDWIEDRCGSSLVIGTDYGIMKWNINSWARRSFSSYDFC